MGTEPGRAARQATLARTVAARKHYGMLPASQDRTIVRGARRLRHLVCGLASRAVRVTREHPGKRAVQPARADDSPRLAAGGVDDSGRVEVREGSRHQADAALRRGLHEHRLRAVHHATARSRQPAFRPVGRPEARMRDPYPGQIVAYWPTAEVTSATLSFTASRICGIGAGGGGTKARTNCLNSGCRKSAPKPYFFISANACVPFQPSFVMR